MTARASKLQQELQQTRPFRSVGHEAVLSILKTADEIRHQVALAVSREGLSLQQYNVLRILRGAGDAGLPTLEIAARLVERSPGITRFIDRLERLELVSRERSGADRRMVRCRATPAGLEFLARLDAPVDRCTEVLLGGIELDRLEELIQLLDQIRTSARPASSSGEGKSNSGQNNKRSN